jgi:putative glycosyltransferase (TIGR04372 family)
MKTPMQLNHKYFIDYAFLPTRSDLLDIWLFTNAEAIISTGSGPDILGLLDEIPILFLNFIPLVNLWDYYGMICSPKKLINAETGKYLSLSEYLDFDVTNSSQVGEEIVDLSEEEILLAVQEFWKRIRGTWAESAEAIELQARFWSEFQEWPLYSKHHDWKHPKARIGEAWLASMGENFFKNN